MNVVDLTRLLVQQPSVTPEGAGCLDIIQNFLNPLGFTCHRLDHNGVSNLYARRGNDEPNLCWAGHVDVVPIQSGWTHPPFEGVIHNDHLIGRGVTDMKGAIAAMLCAARDTPISKGSISFLITSDEEGSAEHGTRHVVEWLKEKGERIDHTIVGEPTNPTTMGTMAKIGRRGSLNVEVHAKGKSGHVAYPQWADNPLLHLLPLLTQLQQKVWDEGTENFDPTHLEVVSLTCPHRVSNIIAEHAWAWLNIRFNPHWTCASLADALQAMTHDLAISWIFHKGADAFMGADDRLVGLLQRVLPHATLSTSGGISDARFIREICPVAEYGLLSDAAHQVDEAVPLNALHELHQTYSKMIKVYFS